MTFSDLNETTHKPSTDHKHWCPSDTSNNDDPWLREVDLRWRCLFSTLDQLHKRKPWLKEGWYKQSDLFVIILYQLGKGAVNRLMLGQWNNTGILFLYMKQPLIPCDHKKMPHHSALMTVMKGREFFGRWITILIPGIHMHQRIYLVFKVVVMLMLPSQLSFIISRL